MPTSSPARARHDEVRAHSMLHAEPGAGACSAFCSLSACLIGSEAMVLHVRCASPDACRLRSLGVFEGARITVVDGRNGMLLDVRGSRLALDRRTAESILVRPVEAA